MIPLSEHRNALLFHRTNSGPPSVIMAFEAPIEIRREFQYAITFDIAYSEMTENFLPLSTAPLNRIEDRIELQLYPNAILVGHITGNGVRRVLFYAKSPLTDSILIKHSVFKKETFSPECKHDPDWSLYTSQIEPSLIEVEYSSNSAVINALAKHGDDPTRPREVDFAANFPNADDRNNFVSSILLEGFSIKESSTWEEDGQFWCEFQKETSIELETISELTSRLRVLAASTNGEFDGWACHTMN